MKYGEVEDFAFSILKIPDEILLITVFTHTAILLLVLLIRYLVIPVGRLLLFASVFATIAVLFIISCITWHDDYGTLEIIKGFRWDISYPTSFSKKCKKLGKAAMVHDVLYNAITCKVVKRACVGEVNDLFDAHMREADFPCPVGRL